MYLSPKKQRFVDFIKFFTVEQNRPPTFVEIMDGLSIKSLGTISWYVKELEKAGVLERKNGYNGKRSLSILEQKITNTLPLLGLIAAGQPLDIFDNTDEIEVPPSFVKPGNFVLKVNGNSMIEDGILDGGASAVLAASIFHFGEYSIQEAKEYLKKENVPVRL